MVSGSDNMFHHSWQWGHDRQSIFGCIFYDLSIINIGMDLKQTGKIYPYEESKYAKCSASKIINQYNAKKF